MPVTDVKNVIIWGNHSSSQYPDVNHGTVKGKPIREVIGDDEYLNNEFIQGVQQRGAAIIKVWRLLVHSFIHSFIRSFVRSFVHSFIHSLTSSTTHARQA